MSDGKERQEALQQRVGRKREGKKKGKRKKSEKIVVEIKINKGANQNDKNNN